MSSRSAELFKCHSILSLYVVMSHIPRTSKCQMCFTPSECFNISFVPGEYIVGHKIVSFSIFHSASIQHSYAEFSCIAAVLCLMCLPPHTGIVKTEQIKQ